MQRLLCVLAAAAVSLTACAPSESAIQTAIGATAVAQAATDESAALTATAGAPTATFTPSATHTPSATPSATDTATPTSTSTPTATPTPTRTPTPSDTPVPSNTPTATRPPFTNTPQPPTATIGPTFLTSITQVRNTVAGVGGQIDLALRIGVINCLELVNNYEFVQARRNLNPPGELAGANVVYQEGVDIFTTKAADIYGNCKSFLANPNQAGGIPAMQWSLARLGVNESLDKLNEAIRQAGGTP